MFHRRILIEYVLMVGLPFLLLTVVLQRGQSLQAPHDVHGAWELQLSCPETIGASCESKLCVLSGTTLTITQSGSYLDAGIVGDQTTLLRGRIEGTHISLQSVSHPDEILNGDTLRLKGTVSIVEQRSVIHGSLAMPRQVDCPPLRLQADLILPVRGRPRDGAR
jgi:hypothetical protein